MKDRLIPFRIVLVEDDDDHAELALYHLERCSPDATVRRLENGDEATAYFRQLEFARDGAVPDLVLLDLKLPRLDGLGVLKNVRSSAVFETVPIVMLSTSDADDDKLAAYAGRANGYVVKPSTFAEYRTLIEGVIGFWQKHNRRPGSECR